MSKLTVEISDAGLLAAVSDTREAANALLAGPGQEPGDDDGEFLQSRVEMLIAGWARQLADPAVLIAQKDAEIRELKRRLSEQVAGLAA